MSLFSSIQMGGNSLQANEIALQVAGQNISNANTPGYLREEIHLVPGPTQKLGGVLLGTGVMVDSITQAVDKFLELRLQGALSDKVDSQVIAQNYLQLEGIVGALDDSSLNNALTTFFNSISQIMDQPQDASIRNLSVLKGVSLTQDINNMAQRVETLREDLNSQVFTISDNINALVEDIRSLNIKIAETEGGSISKSDAVGLRDQRTTDLENLSQLISIRAIEQLDGTVSVYTSGNFLVLEGTSQKVGVVLDSDRGLATASIHIVANDTPIESDSGQLHGLIEARDTVLGGYLDQLNEFTSTLIYEFNKDYSSGQGLKGFTTLTSSNAVDDSTVALNNAGLKFTPENGSFQVLVRNTKTGLTQTTDVFVNLSGEGPQTTLQDIQEKLASIGGINATITIDGRLKISQAATDNEIAFANDTSGTLAALGLNTFFTGSTADDISVDPMLRAEPTLFAASAGGIGQDTNNAKVLAAFLAQPLDSANGASLSTLYDRMIGNVTQGSSQAQATATGADTYATTLLGQKASVSGVNLDEEAVNMIQYQRAYQASAKFIATVNELLDVLMSI
jgi:flagellar hook-associated protein 1 FlgK